MAFFKGSYYEDARAFDPPEDGTPAFRGIRARPSGKAEPVIEHAVNRGDRLDQLAQHYYANPRDWRRLADCNNAAIFAEDLVYEPESTGAVAEERIGHSLLVPRRREGR